PGFTLDVSGVNAGTFRVERFAHTSSLKVSPTSEGPVQVVEVLGGTLEFEDEGKVSRLVPGDLVVVDAETASMTVSRSANIGVVTLSRELLARTAGVPVERMRLSSRPVSSGPAAERWRSAVRHANREIK